MAGIATPLQISIDIQLADDIATTIAACCHQKLFRVMLDRAGKRLLPMAKRCKRFVLLRIDYHQS